MKTLWVFRRIIWTLGELLTQTEGKEVAGSLGWCSVELSEMWESVHVQNWIKYIVYYSASTRLPALGTNLICPPTICLPCEQAHFLDGKKLRLKKCTFFYCNICIYHCSRTCQVLFREVWKQFNYFCLELLTCLWMSSVMDNRVNLMSFKLQLCCRRQKRCRANFIQDNWGRFRCRFVKWRRWVWTYGGCNRMFWSRDRRIRWADRWWWKINLLLFIFTAAQYYYFILNNTDKHIALM